MTKVIVAVVVVRAVVVKSGSTDKQYSSGVPGVPLEVLQKEMRRRVASGSSASPSISVQPSIPSPSEMVDIIYSCSVGVSSKIDEMRLYMLRANIKFLTKSIHVLLFWDLVKLGRCEAFGAMLDFVQIPFHSFFLNITCFIYLANDQL